MSYKQMTGNIISATKVESSGKFNDSSASGVWSLQEQFDYRKGDSWPIKGNGITPIAFWFAKATGSNSLGTSIQTSNISTAGNTTDWGYEMRYAYGNAATTSSATRAVQIGYSFNPSNAASRFIEQLNLVNAGTGTSFGELNVTSAQNATALSNGIRGIFTQGYGASAAFSNVIEYVTIASAGDGTDFGDLTAVSANSCACASTTRGVIAVGKSSGGDTNIISYITIGSAGNATDFGDFERTYHGRGSCSSSTRGLFLGGHYDDLTNNIDYITIASTGNAADFGDLTNTTRYNSAGSSSTRALTAGNFSGDTSNIDAVTIASIGNATEFGDLGLSERQETSCASNVHGGLS